MGYHYNDSTDEEWDAEFMAYMFVVDSSGTYIVHPDLKRIVKKNYFEYAKATADTTDNYLGRRLLERNREYITQDDNDNDIVLEGQTVQVQMMPVDQTNWSIAFVVPDILFNIFGYFLGGLLLFIILVGLLVVFFAGRHSIKKAVKPLKQLSDSADEVAKGNFNTPLPNIKSRDEIHLLRDSFEKMQHSLTQYVEQLKDTTAQKASIESELKIAHNIQMSMLPKTFPPYPERNDIDIYGTLTPAKDVGGDLFDFYIRDEHLFFCIGDVSGKGVPASLVMAVTRSLFRNISAHVSNPTKIVTALNDALTENNDTNMFVTLFVGVLDLGTGMLHYCNAGHDAPVIIPANDPHPTFLDVDPNLPAGIMPKWEFTLQKTVMEPQTIIFLYTDGLNEAEDTAHAQFGEDRIIKEIESLSSSSTPEAIVQHITESVHSFVGEAEQSDDLTMLAIKYQNTNGQQG